MRGFGSVFRLFLGGAPSSSADTVVESTSGKGEASADDSCDDDGEGYGRNSGGGVGDIEAKLSGELAASDGASKSMAPGAQEVTIEGVAR